MTKILAYSLKQSQCPGKPLDSVELHLESQPMPALVETREKCLEFQDTTPFVLKGDIIIMHTLEHSTLGGGKPTEASDWTIFVLSH